MHRWSVHLPRFSNVGVIVRRKEGSSQEWPLPECSIWWVFCSFVGVIIIIIGCRLQRLQCEVIRATLGKCVWRRHSDTVRAAKRLEDFFL